MAFAQMMNTNEESPNAGLGAPGIAEEIENGVVSKPAVTACALRWKRGNLIGSGSYGNGTLSQVASVTVLG